MVRILAPNADACGQHPDPMTKRSLSGRQDWHQISKEIYSAVLVLKESF